MYLVRSGSENCQFTRSNNSRHDICFWSHVLRCFLQCLLPSQHNETLRINQQWYWDHAVKLPGGSTLQYGAGQSCCVCSTCYRLADISFKQLPKNVLFAPQGRHVASINVKSGTVLRGPLSRWRYNDLYIAWTRPLPLLPSIYSLFVPCFPLPSAPSFHFPMLLNFWLPCHLFPYPCPSPTLAPAQNPAKGPERAP